MVIPFGNVVNKNVIYSDTILDFKELGKNLYVKSLNVTKDEFEECIKSIFTENKDVLFHTVQYSKKENKVYFYTNKPIKTTSWKEKDIESFEYKKYDLKTLRDLKDTLNYQDDLDEEKISLYDIWKVYKKKYLKFNRGKKLIEERIDKTISNNFKTNFISLDDSAFDGSVRLFITDANYKNDLTVKFKKNHEDVYISSVQKKGYININKSKLLLYLGGNIKEYFDLVSDKLIWSRQYVNSMDNSSDFIVNISSRSISIIASEFKMTLLSYNKEMEIECNSNDVLSIIRGNEYEIFKRIFVEISKCPEIIQDELHQARIESLKPKEEKRFSKLRKFFKI